MGHGVISLRRSARPRWMRERTVAGADIEGERNVRVGEVAEVAKREGGATAIGQLGEGFIQLAMHERRVNGW